MQLIDGDSETARLCAAGMAVDGDAAEAHALFEQAWDARRDCYEAAIAAHFVARHQASAELRLHWNRIAVEQAEMADAERARPLLASLYLNLGDSQLVLGHVDDALGAASRGVEALAHLPADGYRDFVEMGLARLRARIGEHG